MTDREKLKEAIGVLRTRRMADNTTLDLVLDAAESTLAGPVMPEEPSDEALRAMECCEGEGVQYEYSRTLARAMYRALRSHLLNPQPKTEWVVLVTTPGEAAQSTFDNEDDAVEHARGFLSLPGAHVQIRNRKVPA